MHRRLHSQNTAGGLGESRFTKAPLCKTYAKKEVTVNSK